MVVDLLIKNVSIPMMEGNKTLTRDILVVGEKIVCISRGVELEAGKVVDAKGLLLLPGAIDPHVHFNDPGYTFREDFFHGSLSALYGGVIMVMDIPSTSIPEVTNPENLKIKLEEINNKSFIDFGLYGGISGSTIKKETFKKDIDGLIEEGVFGFKVRTISGKINYPGLSYVEINNVLGLLKNTGLPMLVHAEDEVLVELSTKKVLEEKDHSLMAWVRARPVEAEIMAVKNILNVQGTTNGRVHFVHISSGVSVEEIALAKERGFQVTAETAPHYLFFTQDDYSTLGSILKTAPPVRTLEDREILWEGLKKGIIDYIATDHAPAEHPREKSSGSILTDYAGIPGVQLMLHFMFSEGYLKGRIDLETLVKVTSTNAAKVWGLYPRKGSLAPGADADLVLINPEESWVITPDLLKSKNKYTPFTGLKITGKVERVFLRGKEILRGDLLTGKPGDGRFTRRQ